MKVAIFVLCILIGKFISMRCYEYNIPETIPSYIYTTFYSIPGLVFPNDIEIEVYLSKVAGTLLYSIDNKHNQLIVSLEDSNKATLIISGNKVQSYISIHLLCRCEWCRYERLRLRIQMRDKMYIHCNGGHNRSIEYSKGEIKKVYPTPKFPKSDKLSAKLWLVNTPLSNGIFPNGEQLTGCIFGVWYEGIEVKMETHGVGDKCPVTCTKGVCNDGTCLETYDGRPLCNCTSSFMNGLYCNDTMVSHNVNITKLYVFKTIKMSSRSSSGDVMELRNQDTSLKVFTIEGTLTLRISLTINGVIYEAAKSFTQYEREENHILIMEFRPYLVEVKYLSTNTSWKFARIKVNGDLSKQRFTNIVLQSGNGPIDMVFKNNLWKPQWTDTSFDGEQIRTNIGINLQTNQSISTNKPKDAGLNYDKSTTNNVLWIVTMCLLVIFVIIKISLYFIRRRREKIRYNTKSETVEKDEEVPMNVLASSMENNHQNEYNRSLEKIEEKYAKLLWENILDNKYNTKSETVEKDKKVPMDFSALSMENNHRNEYNTKMKTLKKDNQAPIDFSASSMENNHQNEYYKSLETVEKLRKMYTMLLSKNFHENEYNKALEIIEEVEKTVSMLLWKINHQNDHVLPSERSLNHKLNRDV